MGFTFFRRLLITAELDRGQSNSEVKIRHDVDERRRIKEPAKQAYYDGKRSQDERSKIRDVVTAVYPASRFAHTRDCPQQSYIGSRTPLAHSIKTRHNAPTALVPGLSMSLKPFAAAALLLLSAGVARAQITPITSGLPDRAYNYGYSLSPGYERPVTAQDMREIEIERKYRETLKKIPDKKPVNDPWAGVRPAPVADRHRPQ